MPDLHTPNLVVPAPLPVYIPVAGTQELFPVRRVYCVGRNYAAHIREMKGDEREPPFFFQKPTDAIVASGSEIGFPTATASFQYEVELVLAIGAEGADIPLDVAESYIYGCAVGLDMTRRDLQLKARDTGRPWESGKSFDESAPISSIHPLSVKPLPKKGRIHLSVNGEVRQDGDLQEMIWNSTEIVSQLSQLFTLKPGDLIFTGTPAGVGNLQKGDRIEGFIAGLDEVTVRIR